MTIPPSPDELMEADSRYGDEDAIVKVLSDADPSWRHGCYMREVFHRTSDNTHWEARYHRSTDSETDTLRDGTAAITQVEPYSVTVTKYKKVSQ